MASTSPRPYRKRKRARSEEETRERITEAAVELHGTVGPARTTVTDVAKLAGVSRMTVYNHFPTEKDLFLACSSHWAAEHPFPDPRAWSPIADPSERLATALEDLYGWYGENREMLGKILRDTPLLSSLGEIMQDFWGGYAAQVVQVLAEGWRPGDHGSADLLAMLGAVTDFGMWRRLTASGLETAAAADVAARMVVGALAPDRR